MLPEKDRILLAKLFMGSFKDPYRNPRMAKCEALYQMAREAWGGAIVELGTYHGCGAVTLAFGTRDGNCCPVYTVDDYPQERIGWAGERYSSDDEVVFWHSVEMANVDIKLIKKTVPEAVKAWDEPISLIFWDTAGDNLMGDFWSWSRYLIPGALFAIHDTGDKRFGSPAVIRSALDRGWSLGPVFKKGYIVSIQRPSA